MTTPEEHIKNKLEEFDQVIPYDDFTELATSVAHIYSIPLTESTQLIHKLRGNKEVGSQEFQQQGFGKNNLWNGQDHAHNFGHRPPGDLAEPKSSLGPLSKLELFSYKKGDIVRVVNNDQAPWGGEYKGVIEAINAQDTFDIRDLSTGVLNVKQPAHLLRNPLGEGRPDVRVQQRRVGDPKGMGESHLDSGDLNIKREYPANSWMPSGQSGKDIKNQQSNFYKEAAGPEFNVGDTVSILHPEEVAVIVDVLGPKKWDPTLGPRINDFESERVGDYTLQPEDLSAEDRTGTIVSAYTTLEGENMYTVNVQLFHPVSHLLNNYEVEVKENNLESALAKETLQKEADMDWWPFKSKKEKEHEERKRSPHSYKIGDRVTVTGQGNTWVNCHCGKYQQHVNPGNPGQFYYKDIAGRSGTILAVHGSSHERSGFAFNCYTVLIEDVKPYHLNDMNITLADTMRIKVEEPSKEKLDDLKDKIKDAETAGNKELARQLTEQYMSLTSTKKDPLYSFLFDKIVKEYGAIIATNVVSYIEGKIPSPSKRLAQVLHQYNIVATLNVEKALDEVKDKTEETINMETAWTWGSRAAASYQLANEAVDEKEKDKWIRLGDAYRHESLEHASLVDDEGKLVGEVTRALVPFRKSSARITR